MNPFIKTRFLRIVPKSWTNHICMRVEIYVFQIGKSEIAIASFVNINDEKISEVSKTEINVPGATRWGPGKGLRRSIFEDSHVSLNGQFPGVAIWRFPGVIKLRFPCVNKLKSPGIKSKFQCVIKLTSPGIIKLRFPGVMKLTSCGCLYYIIVYMFTSCLL